MKMLRLKFIETKSQIKIGNILLKRYVIPQMCCASKHNTSSKTKEDNMHDEFDKPIQYSTSKAAKWEAGSHRRKNQPNYQSLVVSLSLSAFCIYFGILREENDIDEMIISEMTPEMKEYLYGIKATNQRNKDMKKQM
ncbi:uncharacterized protein LOC122400700 [Colletes gigas]|uniref:uncharacterized protein LOC122400700 n=1 Tax=Colletes gigas TaxID=935657 RepID=UPI001C9AF2A1|nr:uncharacterized protein LOC122400700 [Colletes gigas]